MTEKELLNDHPKKLFKLCQLLDSGIIRLDDIADIIPGIMHVNSRDDLSIQYISKLGRDIIGYSLEELNKLGAEVLYRHQSDYTIKYTHTKLLKELSKDDINHIIPFVQDWQYKKNEKPVFHFTTTKILNSHQTISISLFPEKMEQLTRRVNSMFGINKVFEEYFENYRCLTKREKELLEFLGKEFSRKEISSSLFISEKTVKKHCENIYRKLGTSKRTDLEKIAKAFTTI